MDRELDLKKNRTEFNSNNKKNLWVITELYYPENNQTGYYMTGIAEGLTRKFNVRVICGQPNYAARGTLASKKENHKNVEIFRVWSTTLNKDVIFFRLINMLSLSEYLRLLLIWITSKSEFSHSLTISFPINPVAPVIKIFIIKNINIGIIRPINSNIYCIFPLPLPLNIFLLLKVERVDSSLLKFLDFQISSQ